MSAQKKFLPSTPLGWIVATTLVVVALFFSMYPLARITGQRLGMVVVDGYSLHNIIPYGSSVFVLPMAAYDGQIVSAWAPEGIDDPENQEDRRPTPVLKVLKGGQLVSTNIDQTVSKFEIRGVVVASIPPLPWMRGEEEKGTTRTFSENEIVEAQIEAINKSLSEQVARSSVGGEWSFLKGYTHLSFKTEPELRVKEWLFDPLPPTTLRLLLTEQANGEIVEVSIRTDAGEWLVVSEHPQPSGFLSLDLPAHSGIRLITRCNSVDSGVTAGGIKIEGVEVIGPRLSRGPFIFGIILINE